MTRRSKHHFAMRRPDVPRDAFRRIHEVLALELAAGGRNTQADRSVPEWWANMPEGEKDHWFDRVSPDAVGARWMAEQK